jgi:hypothetical protein
MKRYDPDPSLVAPSSQPQEAAMSELPKCRLCGATPIQLINGSVKHDEFSSDCSLKSAVLTFAEWSNLMGQSEPVAWMNEHGETLSAAQKVSGLYFDSETFTTPLHTHPAPAVDVAVLRDAERYRWLREQHWSDGRIAVVTDPKSNVKLGSRCLSIDLLDLEIDTAMNEEG